MTAPTEAEIRKAIEADWPLDRASDAPAWIYQSLAPILDSDQALSRRGWVEGFTPQRPHPGTLWADLREDEADELHREIGAVIDRAVLDLQHAVLEGSIAAAVAFAAAHPDIPRGRWPLQPDPVADKPQLSVVS